MDLEEVISQKLLRNRENLRAQFKSPEGTDTRHFICDNLLPEPIAQAAFDSFPKDYAGFRFRNSFREKKKTSVRLDQHPRLLSDITFAMQSPRVVEQIMAIVEMTSLIPDPLLYAGGLSMMSKGDFLHPHIDNSHDVNRRHYRRLNLLYYVTPGWDDASGGNFELWDRERRTPKVLVSKFNRLVVMETNGTSYHSVNEVQEADQPRCCVSSYYFSERSPTGKEYFHATSFSARPGHMRSRVMFAADAFARNAAAAIFKLGRGRKQLYR
jgi:hypothetical protein